MRAFRVLPALVAAALLLPGCDGAAQREAKYMKRAEQLLAERKLDKAALELKNVLQINPTNVEARFKSGIISEEQGRWPRAFSLFNQVLAQDPRHIGANLHLARFYLLAGDLDEAEKRLKVVTEQEPENAQGLAVGAGVLLRRGQTDAAIAQAEAARKIEPGNLQAVSTLAAALRARQQYAEALSVVDEAIAKDPKNNALLMLRISLNVERGEQQLIERDFAALFELAPSNVTYRLALARLYVVWQRPAAAELALRDAIRVAPKSEEVKNVLVAFLREQRNFAEAEKSLKDLIASDPAGHIFSFGLASLYLQYDLAAQAKAIYNAIIQSNDRPRVVIARTALARLSLAEKDAAAARKHIELALEADRDNEDALLLLGRLEFDAQKYDSVIATLRGLLRNKPKSIPALRLLAEAYVRTQRLDLAGDTLGIVLGLTPKDDRARLRLAEIYARQERYDAALEAAGAVNAASDSYQDALRLKAQILARATRFGEATGVVDQLLARGRNLAWVHGLRGQILLRAREYSGAVAAFDQALALGATGPDVVAGLVAAHIGLRQYEQAEQRLKQLIEKDARQAVLHNLLGEVHVRAKKPALAEGAFKKASEIEPSWSIPYINHSDMVLAAGDTDRAIAILNDGLAKSPTSLRIVLALGLAYQRAEKVDEAIAAYERLLKASPNTHAAANNLALLLADHRHQDKQALDRALALTQRFKDSANVAHVDTLGWVHYRRGEFPAAIPYLQRSVEAVPDNAEYRYHLGMAYFRNRQPVQARTELEKAVAGAAKYRGLDEAKATLARLVVEVQ